MIVEAESWDGVGGIGEVGCKSLSITAETQQEALWLAGISQLVFNKLQQGINLEGTIETTDGAVNSASDYINKQRAK